jgi:hypothetical protein
MSQAWNFGSDYRMRCAKCKAEVCVCVRACARWSAFSILLLPASSKWLIRTVQIHCMNIQWKCDIIVSRWTYDTYERISWTVTRDGVCRNLHDLCQWYIKRIEFTVNRSSSTLDFTDIFGVLYEVKNALRANQVLPSVRLWPIVSVGFCWNLLRRLLRCVV